MSAWWKIERRRALYKAQLEDGDPGMGKSPEEEGGRPVIVSSSGRVFEAARLHGDEKAEEQVARAFARCAILGRMRSLSHLGISSGVSGRIDKVGGSRTIRTATIDFGLLIGSVLIGSPSVWSHQSPQSVLNHEKNMKAISQPEILSEILRGEPATSPHS